MGTRLAIKLLPGEHVFTDVEVIIWDEFIYVLEPLRVCNDEGVSLKDALAKCVQEVQSWPMWKQMLAKGDDFRLPQEDSLPAVNEEQSSG